MKIVEVRSLPKKRIMNPYFPTTKTREGKKSVSFLDLETGDYEIEFRTKTKFMNCLVHSWLSPYGYAWEIAEIYKTGKLNDLK